MRSADVRSFGRDGWRKKADWFKIGKEFWHRGACQNLSAHISHHPAAASKALEWRAVESIMESLLGFSWGNKR
jgi:hypothetical protein